MLAGIHSGYFTMRHFRQVTGLKAGKTSQNLLDRVIENKHATRLRSFTKAVRVLGFTDNFCDLIEVPTRRQHEARERLQILDYVIANQHLDYLQRESDKVRHFRQMGIADRLMSRQNGHFFDDRLPIFRAVKAPGFVFVDSGTMAPWESFLDRYAPLFNALKAVRLVFATTSPDPRRGIKTFETKCAKVDDEVYELRRLKAMPLRLLGAPELQRMKRLEDSVGGIESLSGIRLEQYHLGQQYRFLD